MALLAALTGAFLASLAGEAEKKNFAPWLAVSAGLAIAAFALPDPIFNIISRRLAVNMPGVQVYYNEDRAGAVSVVFSRDGRVKSLFINGFAVSGNGSAGKLMSHFPLMFQQDPKEMFIIGLGAANTLHSGVVHGVHVTVAELIASVREAGPLFLKDWDELATTGKFTVRLNDGRNELLRSRKQYDAIVVDVTPPIYSSGAVNLYSRDFFKMARGKLSKTGVFSIWIPKPCFESDYFMMLKSLKEVFPFVNVWNFPNMPGFLALASNQELDFSPKLLEERIKRGNVRQELPIMSADFINKTRFMDTAQVEGSSAAYPAVTDDKPYTEFPLARFLAYSPVWY
jgi:spermidine synthase